MNEKIAVIHALFDSIGGGEKLALSMINSMIKNGYDATLITGSKLYDERIKSILGEDLSNIRYIQISSKMSDYLAKLAKNRSIRLRRILIYRKIFSKKVLHKLRNDYDLIIDTQSNLSSPADIIYIHF